MKQNIIIHHSAGIAYGHNEPPEQVFDDFNRVGFVRGYRPYGYNFDTGISPEWGKNPRTHNGKISYCGYHYGLYTLSPDQYGIVSFVDNREISAGSIGSKRSDETDAQMNARARMWNDNSYAIVFCGNYDTENPPESMIEYFINSFKECSPPSGLIKYDTKIVGHKDTGDLTACPGKYLYTYLDRIRRELDLS
jgi:hypothetical protein